MISESHSKQSTNLQNTTFSFLKTFLNDAYQSVIKYVKLHWVILSIGLLFFIISYSLILRNHPFITGDTGIIGIIIDDFKNGDFLSWYFYGQIYFGNLFPLFIALVSPFVGVSINLILFWDHFCFILAITLVALRVNWVKQWHAVFYFIPLVFLNQFSFYSFAIGYGFTTLLMLSFYFIFDYYWQSNRIYPPSTWFVIGLFTTISLWHYQLYVVILPVFLVLVAGQYYYNKRIPTIKSILFGLSGLLIGIIPFILGGITTDWRNLMFFTSNTKSTNLLSIFTALKYYFMEFVLFFVQNWSGPQDRTFSFDLIKAVLVEPRALVGLMIITILSLALLASLFTFKRNLVFYTYIGALYSLLILRGVDNPNIYYSSVRYSMVALILILTLAIKTLIESSHHFDIPKIQKLFGGALVVFVTLILVVLVPTLTQRVMFHNGLHTYEVAYNDLKDDGITNLYCYNYWELCGQIALLARKDRTLNVQIMDPDMQVINSQSGRNPLYYGTVDKAVREGKPVYSLVPDFLVWSAPSTAKKVKVYKFQGVKDYTLIDQPAICAPQGNLTTVDEGSGLPWQSCGAIEQDYAQYLKSQVANSDTTQ